MKEQLTIHCLVRDEINTIAFALGSTAPYAKRAIVTDTGSTDGTWELLHELIRIYPSIEIEQDLDVPDSRGYHFDEQGQLHVEFSPHNELLRVRNSHIARTDTEWSWIVDGDEVWPQESVGGMYAALERAKDQFRIGFYVPFLHFAKDHYHVAKGTSPVYGRIFKTKGLNVRHEAPYEQHYWHDIWIGPKTQGVELISDAPVHHFQMVYKPWRRVIQDCRAYTGSLAQIWSDRRLQKLTEQCRK